MLDYLTLRPQPVGIPLRSSLSAFLLDREASRCTPKTLEHYLYTCGAFADWLSGRGVDCVRKVNHLPQTQSAC